ncbi:MAG: TolC family protein, partial [Myxococcota bacterium]
MFALSARAQPLTEDEVLEASANLLAVASERLDAQRAEARAEGAGRLSNPTLRFERQESFSPNAQSQDVLSVTWPLPLSGRPRMERSLAHVDGAFARLRRAAMLRTERSALLRVFYAGLAAQARVAILQSGEDALQAARNVIAARVAAGDSAGYDQARIELEVELSRSRIAEARANARSDARRLAFLLGRDTETFAGDFRVSAPAPMNQLIERARAQRSDLRALREVEQSARRAGRISRRAAL